MGKNIKNEQIVLSIVIVNYNSGVLLKDCLRSLFMDPFVEFCEVFVVDNCSNDNSAESAQILFPSIQLIKSEWNCGFSIANNAAIRVSSGRFIFVLNPDTRLNGGDLRTFIDFMEKNTTIGIAGCKLLNTDGSTQYSIRNYPSLINELFECFFLHRLIPSLTSYLGVVVQDEGRYLHAHEVDWISGAAMLMRKEAVEEVGLFDERFFLYAEETDLCHRVKKSGWAIYYYPDLKIVHVGGNWGSSPDLLAENQRGKLRYFRNHNGYVKTLIFQIIALLRLGLRSVLWLVVVVFNGKEKNKKRFAAYINAFIRYPSIALRAHLKKSD